MEAPPDVIFIRPVQGAEVKPNPHKNAVAVHVLLF
jgi:hypothetical protein